MVLNRDVNCENEVVRMAMRRSVSPAYPPPRPDRRAPGVQFAPIDGRLDAARGILIGLALALSMWVILTALVWVVVF